MARQPLFHFCAERVICVVKTGRFVYWPLSRIMRQWQDELYPIVFGLCLHNCLSSEAVKAAVMPYHELRHTKLADVPLCQPF